MIVSARDAEIIAKIGLHADESIPQLARRTRVRAHTLRYVLTRYSERGLLRKRWVVDLMACGFSRYELFFSCGSISKKSRDALLYDLTQLEATTYLAQIGGDFDFELILLTKTSQEVSTIFATLARRYGDITFTKAVAHHHKVHYFPRKYLVKSFSAFEARSLTGAERIVTLDALDHALLGELSRNPEVSRRELAKLCKSTPVTIQAHIAKLRAQGVIKGAMYSFQGAALKIQNYIFLLYTRGLGAELGERLFKFCLQHPRCTNMKECFGSWDFEIGVEVTDYQGVLSFKEELLDTFGQELQKVRLLSRFLVHKYDFYPFRK